MKARALEKSVRGLHRDIKESNRHQRSGTHTVTHTRTHSHTLTHIVDPYTHILTKSTLTAKQCTSGCNNDETSVVVTKDRINIYFTMLPIIISEIYPDCVMIGRGLQL